MDLKTPAVDPNWEPPNDPVFTHLLEEAVLGSVPVYFAALPTTSVVRFQPTFHPEHAKNGDAVVNAIMDEWRRGNFRPIWVYPKGNLFIASDDYFTLAATERGKPDFVPCWVLGLPSKTIAKDIKGPIAPKDVRKMLALR
jgi:hypothetical protein